MNSDDQKIQELIFERKKRDDMDKLSDDDKKMYTKLDEYLSSEPDMNIPGDFSVAVLKQIEKEAAKKQWLRNLSIFFGLLVAGVMFAYGAFSYSKSNIMGDLLNTINDYSGYLILGIAAFTFIQLFDHILLKKDYRKMMRM